jgi:cyclopropane fatty-acyl-phospholipid synthase-like methyltransferase
MRRERSLEPDYFETLYRDQADPWGFESSAYEANKYADTLAALGDERARAALEIGCSIGVLTRQLAAHCDALTATEVSPTAMAEAQRRCADLPHVTFRLARTATDAFEGAFDLIVLSEVVYYWDDADLAAVAAALDAHWTPGGRLLLVHWTGETDYPKSADEAVDGLATLLRAPLIIERQDRRPRYRLDLWRRGPDATR